MSTPVRDSSGLYSVGRQLYEFQRSIANYQGDRRALTYPQFHDSITSINKMATEIFAGFRSDVRYNITHKDCRNLHILCEGLLIMESAELPQRGWAWLVGAENPAKAELRDLNGKMKKLVSALCNQVWKSGYFLSPAAEARGAIAPHYFPSPMTEGDKRYLGTFTSLQDRALAAELLQRLHENSLWGSQPLQEISESALQLMKSQTIERFSSQNIKDGVDELVKLILLYQRDRGSVSYRDIDQQLKAIDRAVKGVYEDSDHLTKDEALQLEKAYAKYCSIPLWYHTRRGSILPIVYPRSSGLIGLLPIPSDLFFRINMSSFNKFAILASIAEFHR